MDRRSTITEFVINNTKFCYILQFISLTIWFLLLSVEPFEKLLNTDGETIDMQFKIPYTNKNTSAYLQFNVSKFNVKKPTGS
jgi:hypothetical protein